MNSYLRPLGKEEETMYSKEFKAKCAKKAKTYYVGISKRRSMTTKTRGWTVFVFGTHKPEIPTRSVSKSTTPRDEWLKVKVPNPRSSYRLA